MDELLSVGSCIGALQKKSRHFAGITTQIDGGQMGSDKL